MNPGYAGRTELPESVKALFRPVTCIKPDLELICLISLFSDGFLTAKVSAFLPLPPNAIIKYAINSLTAIINAKCQ